MLAMLQLTEDEMLKLESIKLEKRKREWLSIKILVNLFADGNALSFQSNGKPVLTNGLHISISHSGDLAGLIVSDESVGLDIQGVEERIQNIERKFTNERERLYLPNDSTRIEFLTIIWSIKEAVFKFFGEQVDFSEDIYVKPFLPHQASLFALYEGAHGAYEFELSNIQNAGYSIIFTTSFHQVNSQPTL